MRSASSAPTRERSPLGVTQLYVSDEEIGSPTSRALIEAEGRKAKYVLVTEPARDGGKIVTGRKGVARFEVFIKGVPVACRHAARRRPQRDPRTRQRHSDAGGDERSRARRDASMSASSEAAPGRTSSPKRPMPRSTCAFPRIADADELVAKILEPEIAQRRRQRQGDRRIEPAALRERQCRRGALRARQDARRRNRLRTRRHLDRRRLRRQFHRAPYRNPRRPRRRRQGRAYPLRADVHLVDRAADAAVASALSDAAMSARTGDRESRERTSTMAPLTRTARSSAAARATSCARIRPT